MARLNNDAREILCNMVTEKAGAKRKKLVETIDAIDNETKASYDERVKEARKEIEAILPAFKSGIDRILSKHKLGWKSCRYGDERYTFDDVFSDGDLRADLHNYFSDGERKSNRRLLAETQLKDLDARIAKAKQEILLRAALGMKYDEVVSIINSFQF